MHIEHHNDIVAWTNTLQVATSLVVKQMQVNSFLWRSWIVDGLRLQTARFPALWKNQEVDFIIDYNHGLLVQSQDNKVTWFCNYNTVYSIKQKFQ